jgi:HEAT repeat protein
LSETPTDPPAPPEEAEEPRQTTPFLVLQFFIFPMAIVAVCVTVFVVFGLIASEGKSARDYLSEVRSGGANRRWQAAFELSKVLQGRKDAALKDPRFSAEAVALFRDSANDDPRVRRYLALALGRLGDRAAVPVLREALVPDAADSETVIYAMWALGTIGDPAAIPDLLRFAKSEDKGYRKAAIHSLGAFPDPTAQAAVKEALLDAAEDVRWNAAISLGYRGDPAAVPVLGQMLDRGALARMPDVSPAQAEEAALSAAAAAAHVDDASLRAALEKLRDDDPSLKVREAAREALAAKR